MIVTVVDLSSIRLLVVTCCEREKNSKPNNNKMKNKNKNENDLVTGILDVVRLWKLAASSSSDRRRGACVEHNRRLA